MRVDLLAIAGIISSGFSAKFATSGLIALSVALSAYSAGDEIPLPETRKSASQELSRETAERILDEVWTTVKEKHFDDKMNNVDWDLVRSEHIALLEGCSSEDQLVKLLNGMVRKLGQSHLAVFRPPSRIEIKARSIIEKETSDSKILSAEELRQPGDVGLRLCLSEKRIHVLEVKTGSSADEAGIKAGDMIASINNVPFASSQTTDVPISLIAQSMLLGRPGSGLEIEYVGSDNKTSKVSLKRRPTGTKWFQLGLIPASAVCFDYRNLPESIAYVQMSPCFSDQIMMFREILPEINKRKALIIDLRNNPGGFIMFPNAMGGWISGKEIFFGTMKTRNSTLNLKSNPQAEAFKGPIAVLIDGGTASVAEVFAAGLQDSGRASIFGECSSGACLPSIFMELKCGYRLQTVFGDYTRASGKPIEKVGVIPDFTVSPNLPDLRAGRDTSLEAAKKWLLEKLQKE